MRTPTPAMQAKLNQQYGTEPYLIVGVNWAGSNFTYYADKSVLDNDGNVIIPGKILTVNNIESILNVSGTKSSVSIDVTFDDSQSEDSFLNLLNNVDIHKRLARLYLMFEGLTLGDELELFEGYIISGVSWEDNDRVFKITIESLFNNYEAGFSPEEGDVVDLREDLIGKAWPMVFGTVIKMPLARITDIPSAVTTEPMGFHDYWLDWQIIQLGSYSDLYQAAIEDQVQIILGDVVAGDLDAQEQDEQALDQILFAYNDVQTKRANLQGLLAQQLPYDKTSTYVLTDYPINLTGIFEAGGVYLQGKLSVLGVHSKVGQKLQVGQAGYGSSSTVQGVAFFEFTGPYHSLPDATGFNFTPTRAQAELIGPTQIGIISPQTGNITDLAGAVSRDVSAFRYIEAGTALKFLGNYPVKYVVNIWGGSTIHHVYAKRSFESYSRRFKIPKSYYKHISVIAQNSRQPENRRFICDGIRLFRPLNTLLNQHWDDNELYATVTSPVGPDIQSVLIYIVRTFTVYDVDLPSLAAVPSFRLNFAVLELKEVLTLIEEICFQNKMSATLKNGKFKFTYLPKYITPTISIGLNDLIEDSLSLSFTPIDSIITKMTGTWRIDWSDEKQNKIVIRYNVGKYGVIEETHDFYCFNTQKAVEASMSFWLYRRGNSWKQLKLKLPLKYIVLENYDIINVGADVCALYGINGGNTTPCVVKSLTYDSVNSIVDVELELPIKLGENVVDKNYWPSGSFEWMGAGEVSQIFNNILPPKWWDGVDYTPQAMLEPIFIGAPNDQSIPSGGVTGISFDNRHDSLELSPEYDFNMSTQNPPSTGNMPTSVVGGYGGTLGDYNSPQIQIGSPNKDVKFNEIEPKFPLRYSDNQQQQQQQKQITAGASSFPGFTIGKAGSTSLYNCNLYRKGLDVDPEIVQVRILQLDSTDTIPANTGIMISEIKATKKDDFGQAVPVTLYYGQIAVWLG